LCVKNKAASSFGGPSFLAWIGSVSVKHSENGKAGVRAFIHERAENLVKKGYRSPVVSPLILKNQVGLS
jgi:hypothetical protein